MHHPRAIGIVSILTRPEDRVQRGRSRSGVGRTREVSILTRPEDRVQLAFAATSVLPDPMFQSSPGPKTGCNMGISFALVIVPSSFNPHPARRPGATTRRRDGPAVFCVSILTRPEDRVQLVRLTTFIGTDLTVSILTRPEDRVQRGTRARMARRRRFNPHPARRPGATSSRGVIPRGRRGFNPHPARRPGATRSNCGR